MIIYITNLLTYYILFVYCFHYLIYDSTCFFMLMLQLKSAYAITRLRKVAGYSKKLFYQHALRLYKEVWCPNILLYSSVYFCVTNPCQLFSCQVFVVYGLLLVYCRHSGWMTMKILMEASILETNEPNQDIQVCWFINLILGCELDKIIGFAFILVWTYINKPNRTELLRFYINTHICITMLLCSHMIIVLLCSLFK